MLAACNVEISFIRFGMGMPESKARWGPVSTQVWKHKRCKPKHKLPIGRYGETILTLTVMDEALSCRGLIDTGPFRAERHHVLVKGAFHVSFAYKGKPAFVRKKCTIHICIKIDRLFFHLYLPARLYTYKQLICLYSMLP